MVREGTARKLGPRRYTRNVVDEPEAIVSRNLWPIVALLMPGTVVSHRTAFENRAAPDGSVFVSGAYPRAIELPGKVLRQVKGVGVSMFPFILPSSFDPASSLTVWDASSSRTTLLIMLAAVVLPLPIVLAYTAFIYRVMRGKVTKQQVEADHFGY
jgi:cytochrome bd-type quinol oxidase subunit 2